MKQLLSVLVVTCAFSLVTESQEFRPKGPLPPADGKDRKTYEAAEQQNAGYVIGPEDVLSIVVFGADHLSAKVTVRADGKVALLLLDEVQASGLTPQELKEVISQGLRKFLTDPQVYVIPLEIKSQFVYIVGSVAKPGVYPLGTSLRVTELLVRAGGLTEFAKPEQIIIMRQDGANNTRFPFNYKTFLGGKNFAQDIPLKSRDMVIVP
jgi:polysaccharide export outer membrane protein